MAGGVAIAPRGGSSELAAILAGRDLRWYKGYQLRLIIMLFFILITSVTNGYDSSMMNGLQSLDTWKSYFKNPQNHPNTFGLYTAILNIGGIVALPCAPYIADKFGRRMGIFVGCGIMIVGCALQAGALNPGMFLAGRGIVGFGVTIAHLAAPVLITELAFPTYRAPLTNVYNSLWYLGSIIAAWTTYGTFRINNQWGWRIPSILMALAPIVQFVAIWFIPESPRWLINNGKTEQALDIIAKWHCDGNRNDPLVEFEYAEMQEMIRSERESKETTYASLFKTKGNRRRMRIVIAIAFFSQWSGNGLVSYYLTLILNSIGITKQSDQTLFNGILQIYNLFCAASSGLLVDRAGRRPLFLASTGGMCLSFICWTISSAVYTNSSHTYDQACLDLHDGNKSSCVALDANKHAGHAVIAFIYLFYTAYNLAMSPLIVGYTVEIMPYSLRAKGLMMLQLGVSCASTFNQYTNPIALDALGWKYYICFCVFIAFEFVYCYLFVIETRGKNGILSLEEIGALFDGPARWGFQKDPAVDGTAVDHENAPHLSKTQSNTKDGDIVHIDDAEGVKRL